MSKSEGMAISFNVQSGTEWPKGAGIIEQAAELQVYLGETSGNWGVESWSGMQLPGLACTCDYHAELSTLVTGGYARISHFAQNETAPGQQLHSCIAAAMSARVDSNWRSVPKVRGKSTHYCIEVL